jgi:acetaldehyde dehydrogenase
MVYAVSRVTPVSYAEIVATVASRSAGPGTRANIDEFTRTTSRGLAEIGGAARGKAIIVLNPADPPIVMRDTIFCAVDPGADTDHIGQSIVDMVADVARYVPGYRLVSEPQFDPYDGQLRVAVFVEITGAGDFLPPYAGNLDIMTAAATRVGEELAGR